MSRRGGGALAGQSFRRRVREEELDHSLGDIIRQFFNLSSHITMSQAHPVQVTTTLCRA